MLSKPPLSSTLPQGVRLLDRPAQSPDLSPVEYLWKHLKKRPNDYKRPAKGVWKLWERIEAEWGRIGDTSKGRAYNVLKSIM